MSYTKFCTFLVHHDIRRYQLRDVLDPESYRCIGSIFPIYYEDLLLICSYLECDPDDLFDEDDLTFIYARRKNMNYYDQLVAFYDFLKVKVLRNSKSDILIDHFFGAVTFAYYSKLIDKTQYNSLLSKFDLINF